MLRDVVRFTAACLCGLSLAVGSQVAVAGNLVANGDFEINGGGGQIATNTTVGSWTVGGKEGQYGGQTTAPVFLFPAGTGQTGVAGDSFMGTVSFWAATDSPTGGAYIAADGSPGWDGSISQVVGGLTAGNTYTVEFDWAGGQQQGYDGATTEAWSVTFGSSTQSTSTVNVPNHGFSGWSHESLSFTAGSMSEVLTFLAVGTPGGLPPWLFLDGVIVKDQSSGPPGPSPVPEPSTLAIVAVGALGLIARRIGQKANRA